MSKQDVVCPRHGGEWGDDETCEYCVNDDGTINGADVCVEIREAIEHHGDLTACKSPNLGKVRS